MSLGLVNVGPWEVLILLFILGMGLAAVAVVLVVVFVVGKKSAKMLVRCGCGATCEPGSRYCSQCGRPLDVGSPSPPSSPSNP